MGSTTSDDRKTILVWNKDLAKRVSWYALVVCFSLNVIAQELFMFTRPRIPVPAVGRVYPLNEHGTLVYLTYWEHLITGHWSTLVLLVLALIWVALNRLDAKS